MPLNLNQTEHIALALFPDDFHDGSDCRAEMNREGKPCRVCADNRERWLRSFRLAIGLSLIRHRKAPAAGSILVH